MLEAAAVAGLVVVVAAFLEGSRSVIVFLALVVFFATWGAQAIDAHRRAVEAGGAPGGAEQLLALGPVAAIVMTAFWLLAGASGTPDATLQRYVSAWRADRPEQASALFLAPPRPDELSDRWERQRAYLRDRLAALTAGDENGPDQGLDPDRPLDGLVVTLDEPREAADAADADADRVVANVDIVRPVRRETTFLGIFPTARQEMVPIERVGQAVLVAVPLDPPEGLGGDNEIWRIESFEVPPGSP